MTASNGCSLMSSDSTNVTRDIPSLYASLDRFYSSFAPVHGILCVFICVFGFLAAACNVLTLTRPRMVSQINILLTGMAVCDLIIMPIYLAWVLHYKIFTYECDEHMYTYPWAVFTVLFSSITVPFRAISLWLSVVMAFVRRMVLANPVGSSQSRQYVENQNRTSVIQVITVTVIILLLNIPIYLSYTVERETSYAPKPRGRFHCPNVTYQHAKSRLSQLNDCFLDKLTFWFNGICLKLVPSLLLCCLLISLLVVIHQSSKRRERLGLSSNANPTTQVLLVICMITLVAELPNATLSIASGALPPAFAKHVYNNLGDIMDMLSLLNSIITFILYCAISKQYRDTFKSLFVTQVAQVIENQFQMPINDNTKSIFFGDSPGFRSAFFSSPTELTRSFSLRPSCSRTSLYGKSKRRSKRGGSIDVNRSKKSVGECSEPDFNFNIRRFTQDDPRSQNPESYYFCDGNLLLTGTNDVIKEEEAAQ